MSPFSLELHQLPVAKVYHKVPASAKPAGLFLKFSNPQAAADALHIVHNLDEQLTR